MNEKLANKKCVPCEGGTLPLTEEETNKLLAQISANWHLIGNKIFAEFKFKNFKEAMAFVNKVAAIAESEGHHPDIHINYSKVKFELWTHAIGGLSINDYILASKIDQISKT